MIDFDNDRIDKRFDYGQHIPLTCENHPDLRWNTKNISFIGARSLFFSNQGYTVAECTCSINDLRILTDRELERALVRA